MQTKNLKKNQNSLNLANIKSIFSDLQKKHSIEDLIKLLKLFELQQKLKLSPEQLLKQLEEIQIPISIFKTNLAPLESLVKYLKENLNYSHKKISFLLNRSNKTIWSSYNSAIRKKTEKFIIKKPKFLTPLSVFSNRKFSILESLVSYLKSQQLSFKQISNLLQKDYRTIWTVYNRAKKK